MNPVEIFAALALLVGVAWLLTFVARLLARIWRSRKWPSVPGTVQKGIVEEDSSGEGGTTYRCVVQYNYAVGGETRAGLFALEVASTDEGHLVLSQTEGRAVTVHFDPKRPQISFVAEKEIDGHSVGHEPQFVEFARDLAETTMTVLSVEPTQPKQKKR